MASRRSGNFRPGGFEDSFDDDLDGFDFGFGDAEKWKATLEPQSVNQSNNHCQVNGTEQDDSIVFKSLSKPQPVQAQPVINGLVIDDLRQAIMNGNLKVVTSYLEQGINADVVLKSGWTPLMYAASCANYELVCLLLTWGADANFHKDQYTSLMAVCGCTHREDTVNNCVLKLLESNADINAFDRYHMTALMYASKEGRIDVVKTLLEHGADVNQQDNRGQTALVLATYRRHVKVIDLLLSHNADPNVKTTNKDTAIDIASSKYFDEITELLRNAGCQLSTYSGRFSSPWSHLPVTSNPTTTDDSNITNGSLEIPAAQLEHFGELELFLSGLELSDYIPLFHQHHVTFSSFLRMTDNDLKQIGVARLGQRKKILDAIQAVHKQEWEESSLTSQQYNKHINCATALAMVKNIAKHVDYIGSTIGYAKDQIKAHPDVLKRGQDGTGVKSLCKQTEDSLRNTRELYKELVELRQYLSEVADIDDYKPADLVEYKHQTQVSKTKKMILYTLTVGAMVAGFGYFTWKKQLMTT
ncbi:ankyrin repeat, SAM and basic leucine zipper domain-containing protein 1-like [Tubulanus polymorphus]|uniref:ankyrin repeat, SAM and basic leucine zipper domain-containing protein 1-like n=1 Tax=Tubulanus polymorphus TaxID=672921 RepID=UPI003DA6C7E4